jgi:FkbM family methyltransferase
MTSQSLNVVHQHKTMSLKDAFNPLFSLAARGCEHSPMVADMIRRLSFRGKGRIVERIRTDGIPREITAVCNGIQYRLDLRDDVQREIYFNVFERRELKLALSLIPAGGMCLDIGANNGIFALQFAKKVGPTGKVHAFEPDANIFSRLLANCRLNGFQNVRCHRLAVSDVTGPITFYKSDPHHSGWGSLQKFNDIAISEELSESVTVDEFLEKEGIHCVDFLKIDVEAYEPELLRGAVKSLQRHVLRHILIEFNGIRLFERGISLEQSLEPILANNYVAVDFRKPRLTDLQDGTVLPRSVCSSFLFVPGN